MSAEQRDDVVAMADDPDMIRLWDLMASGVDQITASLMVWDPENPRLRPPPPPPPAPAPASLGERPVPAQPGGVPGFYVVMAPDLPPSATTVLARAAWAEVRRITRRALSRRPDVSDLRYDQRGQRIHGASTTTTGRP